MYTIAPPPTLQALNEPTFRRWDIAADWLPLRAGRNSASGKSGKVFLV